MAVLGYGPSLLLLPTPLRPWFWLCVPLVGLVVAAIGLGWLVLVMPGGLAGMLLLAVSLGAAVWTALLGRRPPAIPGLHELLAVLACCLVAVLVGVAPLIGRPDLIAIGSNWDIEIYVPTAAYLQNAPLGFGLEHPAGFPFPGQPNPLLWRANFFDPRWSGLTFQELHAALNALGGMAPHTSFSGLLAALFGLFSLSVFLMVRVGFGATVPAALVSASVTAVGVPGLYVLFRGFGQHTVALVLVPFSVLAVLVMLRAPGRASRLLVGAAGASLVASYVPALPAFLVMAGMAALAHLVGTRRLGETGRSIGFAAGAAVVLAPWAVWRCIVRTQHFLTDRGIAGLTQGEGIIDFPHKGWWLGYFAAPTEGFMGVLPAGFGEPWLHAVLVVLMAFGAVTLWRTGHYATAGLALTPLVALVTLRYLMPYPYGYVKTIPFMVPLLLGVLVIGVTALPRAGQRFDRAARLGLAFGGAMLVGFNAIFAIGYIHLTRADSPMAFRPIEQLAAAVPANSSVFVSGHSDQRGPRGVALAYALRDVQLFGYVDTVYSSFYREQTDGVYDFALVSKAEPAWQEFEDRRIAPVWSGLGMHLVKLPGGLTPQFVTGPQGPGVTKRSTGPGGASGSLITGWTGQGYPEFTGWSPPLLGMVADITIVPVLEIRQRSGGS